MKNLLAPRTCPWCGKVVTDRKYDGFCSPKCRETYTMGSDRVCRICGEPIPMDGPDTCWYCASAATEENAMEAAAILSPKMLKRRFCHDCGKPCSSYRCKECWDRLRQRNAVDVYWGVFDLEDDE